MKQTWIYIFFKTCSFLFTTETPSVSNVIVEGCKSLFQFFWFQAVEFVEASIDHINAHSKELRRLFLVEDIVDSIKVYFLVCQFDILSQDIIKERNKWGQDWKMCDTHKPSAREWLCKQWIMLSRHHILDSLVRFDNTYPPTSYLASI